LKHYIYEIEGVRVGCTKDIRDFIRISKNLAGVEYKVEDFKILEILEDNTSMEADKKKREYQSKLGYRIDKIGRYVKNYQIIKNLAEKNNEICCKNGTGFFNKENHPNKKGHATNRKNGTGIYDPEVRAKAHVANRENRTGLYDPGVRAKGLETNRKNGTGVYNSEVRAKGLETQRKNGTGLFDPSVRSKNVETNRKNGTGIFDPEVRVKSHKVAAEINRKNGTGVYAKIKCKYCDYVGNALSIGRYHNEKCKHKPRENKIVKHK